MHFDWTKLGYAIAAAIFGWVFAQLPGLVKRRTTWLLIGSYLGMAIMVGLFTYGLVTWVWPTVPQPMLCSLAALFGAACDKIVPQLIGQAARATDRAGEALIDRMGNEKDDADGGDEAKESPEK